MLEIIIFTLFVSTLLNLLLKYFDIPTIIGYITTGIIIAYSFNLHSAVNNHDLKIIAEFGVVFLMFTIGLEFSIKHLIRMRKEVFLYGGLQVLLSALFFGFIADIVFNIETKSAIIIAFALALSSTAIVLKTLNESGDINKKYGRKVLGVLLFQDIAVIPILLMITIFSIENKSITTLLSETALDATILLIGLFLTGKYLLEPFLYQVSKTKSNEIFISSILLIVIGSSYLAHFFSFSYSLGAFIAGMMIAETQYRHQVEADLIPFRDLLLGIFFITVGMQLNFSIIVQYLAWISLLLPLLIVTKIVIIYNLLKFGTDKRSALKSALALFQLGEFALVIFELASSEGLLNPIVGQVLIVIVVLSMIITPFVLKKITYLTDKLLPSVEDNNEILFQETHLSNHTVLIGYGRLGKNIAKLLKKEGLTFVVIEGNIKTVKDAQKLNEPIIFGNAGQKNILELVNIKKASAVIISVENSQKLRMICETVNSLTYNTKTIVKVDNYEEESELADLNLSHIIVETEKTAIAMVKEAQKI